MDDRDDSWTNRVADLATEAKVLHRVLAAHPVLLTLAELVREIAGEDPEFAERDAIERAVLELTGVGLLHHHGEFVLPTRAALHFSELADR